MDTQDILDAALRLAKQSEIPSDTTINVPAKNVRRALFGIDVEAADLWIAKEKGYDVVIAHHPTGGSATLDFPKVLVKHADILTRHGCPEPSPTRPCGRCRRSESRGPMRRTTTDSRPSRV